MENSNSKEQNKQRSIKSGEMMQGICLQWFIDVYGVGSNGVKNGLILYISILRKSFGYRDRYAYIPQNYFGLSPNSLKKYRDKLTELGIIEWKATKQMTMYKILEPADKIKTFQFLGRKKDEENIEKKITEEEENIAARDRVMQYM